VLCHAGAAKRLGSFLAYPKADLGNARGLSIRCEVASFLIRYMQGTTPQM